MVTVRTIETKKNGVHNITKDITEIIKDSGIKNGILTIEIPYTTASLFRISTSDSLLKKDLNKEIKNLLPSRVTFHSQDSPEHVSGLIKSALFGNSITSIIYDGNLVNPDSNTNYFIVEYGSPRKREIYLSIIEEN